MAPKRKAKTAADASPAKAAPGGRTLRSSGRVTRSNSEGARLVSLEDTQKKSPAKKKQKKSPAKKPKKAEPKDQGKKVAEGPSGTDAGADPKVKGKKAAVPEGGDSDAADEAEEDDDPNRTVIVVEHWYFTLSLFFYRFALFLLSFKCTIMTEKLLFDFVCKCKFYIKP